MPTLRSRLGLLVFVEIEAEDLVEHALFQDRVDELHLVRRERRQLVALDQRQIAIGNRKLVRRTHQRGASLDWTQPFLAEEEMAPPLEDPAGSARIVAIEPLVVLAVLQRRLDFRQRPVRPTRALAGADDGAGEPFDVEPRLVEHYVA
jgi:hypothetical protein